MTKFSLQSIIRIVEVGEAQFLTRLLPLTVLLLVIASVYDFVLFRGLDNMQSMDNAQLARQIVRGEGYTTRFLRPQAVADLQNHAAQQGQTTGGPGVLFPAERYPAGAPRILPDTYNAPGYPYLLATWFYIVKPKFDQAVSPHLDGFISPVRNTPTPIYSGDFWIPILNFIFIILTGLLIYVLGRRLYDDRVAWLAAVAFFFTNIVWQYGLTALSTNFLMFLMTGVLVCTLEIFCIAESCFESEDQTFGMAWVWGLLLSLFLVVTCLTRLHLIVYLIPLMAVLFLMPRPSWGLFAVISVITIGCVLPWFWHLYKVTGHPLGSNLPLLMYGTPGYKENQIFCMTSIPSYDSLYRNLSQKQCDGYVWHFEHAWQMLGSNPLILLYVVSLTHAYKRRRAQMFQWFLAGTALVIIGANNFGVAQPTAVGAWNNLILLFPAMLVVGSAFFFIQLDRLNIQVWILNNILVVLFLAFIATPMAITMTTFSNLIYAFPPYMPPLIRILGDYTQKDEWVTTDLPWASAWYADRPSLWLPDSTTDFARLNDNVCPTGILYFTPESWAKPASNILTGEDHEWLPFVVGSELPSGTTFPLRVHTATPRGGPDYIIWSDKPRWNAQ